MSTRANSSSFQLKMKQISAVAAIPGEMIGTMTERSVVISPVRAPLRSMMALMTSVVP